ncbi:MAG TPA: cyclic nucleotide-binding domain-containing protein [Acetobacteraceae bacterium]|nr:cyclic nucleotide-binding domain-containing protein [Acetobacteraceae bacterium]
MEIRRFARGDILFQDGDAIDRVFRVLAGEVEIVRNVGDQAIVMGTVGAGQFLGEMGVVEERAGRGATARAAGAVEAEMLSPAEFFDRLDHTPGMARDLIRRLSQRLRAADERIVGDEARGHPARGEAPVHAVRIVGASPWVQRQMPEPLAVGHLPFVVGRRTLRGEEAPHREPDLVLDDNRPFRLSRDHFMILARNGSLYLRDLFSTLGTIVNGVAIGEHFGRDEVKLRPGANTVIAGGGGSRFVFSVTVA